MKVKYESNNSGGSWWLKDKDWKALAAAGWEVEWGGTYFCGSDFPFSKRPDDRPDCGLGKECRGHRMSEKPGKRYLDALAKAARKDFPTVADGIREFERITGLDVTDEGCGCCGAPHTFYWGSAAGGEGEYGYASGEELVRALYGEDTPRSLREAVERSRR